MFWPNRYFSGVPDTSIKADVRALLRFRDELELGDGLFYEITGIEASELFAYRRGKVKERPMISAAASARVERCRAAMKLAMELTQNEERALDWLYAESPTFGGKCPVDMTISEAGLQFLKAYIDKLRAAVTSASQSTQNAISTLQNASVPHARETSGAPQNVPREAPVAERKPVSPGISTFAKSTPTAANIANVLATPLVTASSEPSQSAPKASASLEAGPPPPPDGVNAGERVFRLKEPLARIRDGRPEITLKNIAQRMVARGFAQYEKPSYMSRVANSYAWVTWEEVVAMAEVLQVDPGVLGEVWTS